jgi:hypothetical protein
MADAVDAYLQLTEAQARAQWQSIHQRVPLARQVAFLPVETLLSYAVFYLLNPHRFGGGNIDQVPPEVKALAATFKRLRVPHVPPSERVPRLARSADDASPHAVSTPSNPENPSLSRIGQAAKLGCGMGPGGGGHRATIRPTAHLRERNDVEGAPVFIELRFVSVAPWLCVQDGPSDGNVLTVVSPPRRMMKPIFRRVAAVAAALAMSVPAASANAQAAGTASWPQLLQKAPRLGSASINSFEGILEVPPPGTALFADLPLTGAGVDPDLLTGQAVYRIVLGDPFGANATFSGSRGRAVYDSQSSLPTECDPNDTLEMVLKPYGMAELRSGDQVVTTVCGPQFTQLAPPDVQSSLPCGT